MNELVVLKRGNKHQNLYLDVMESGPLTGWIGLKQKPARPHRKNTFIYLERNREKLLSRIERGGWEFVEGLEWLQ